MIKQELFTTDILPITYLINHRTNGSHVWLIIGATYA